MSVSRPALSRDSVAPGTSRTMRRATCCMRAKLAARTAVVLLIELAQRRPPLPARQRHRAVLRHDRIHRPLQRERLAPADRPAGDGDHVQAGCAQRRQRLAARPAVTAPSVVSVSSMSVKHAVMPRLRAAGQLASGCMPAQPAQRSFGRAAVDAPRPGARGCALLANGGSSGCMLHGRLPCPGGQAPVSTWSRAASSSGSSGRAERWSAGSSSHGAGGREAARVVAEALGVDSPGTRSGSRHSRSCSSALEAVGLAAGGARRRRTTSTSMPRRLLMMDSLAEQVQPRASARKTRGRPSCGSAVAAADSVAFGGLHAAWRRPEYAGAGSRRALGVVAQAARTPAPWLAGPVTIEAAVCGDVEEAAGVEAQVQHEVLHARGRAGWRNAVISCVLRADGVVVEQDVADAPAAAGGVGDHLGARNGAGARRCSWPASCWSAVAWTSAEPAARGLSGSTVLKRSLGWPVASGARVSRASK